MPREHALRSVGQGFAETPDSAVIGRNQPVLLRHAISDSQARDAGRRGDSGGDQLAARNSAHVRSVCVLATRPVIIARMRLLNPANHTIPTWISRKSTSARDTKK